MNQVQKAIALEAMLNTVGWEVLYDYLRKNSVPSTIPIDGLDSLIRQSYRNGVSQGHMEVLNFIKASIENGKRNQEEKGVNYPFGSGLLKYKKGDKGIPS